jgi:peptidyl-prolyl cis-trans isomerase SurA
MFLMMMFCATLLSAEEIIDRIMAIVDDEIILESEVFQYLQFNVGSQVDLESLPKSTVDSLQAQILDELIDQKLLLTKARLDTVIVSEREVDNELDNRVKSLTEQIGGEDKLEEYYGMPLPKIKRQFRPLVEEGLMIDMVKRQKLARVRVTRVEVLEFWKVYRDSIPELRDAIRIAHILLQDELSDASVKAAVARADSARQLILSGEYTFEEYATEFSEDPGSAINGGKLGTTSRGDLVPEYEAVAYELEAGEISSPVPSPFGVHVIKLISRTGEKISSSHILFKVVPAEEDMQNTLTRADSIAKEARSGADFTALALQYSVDSKTAAIGGDLGWYSPDELPAEFHEPLVGLKRKEVAEPFRTLFGVHIAKVTDRVFSRPITLDEDYDRIEKLAVARKQETEYDTWLTQLASETYIERK